MEEKTINELCPNCGHENIFALTDNHFLICTNCGFALAPCSLCNMDRADCNNCKIAKIADMYNEKYNI